MGRFQGSSAGLSRCKDVDGFQNCRTDHDRAVIIMDPPRKRAASAGRRSLSDRRAARRAVRQLSCRS